jgi:hypothetical protein
MATTMDRIGKYRMLVDSRAGWFSANGVNEVTVRLRKDDLHIEFTCKDKRRRG